MFAHEEAEATAEGEPGDAGVAHDAAGGGQTVGLSLVVDVAPQRTTLHQGRAAGGVDPHGPHRREVDDDPVVAHRGAGHVVAPAPDGDLKVVVAGDAHGRGHIGGPAASGDQPGAPVDGAVPHGSGGVVVGVVGGDQLAPEPVDLHRGCLLAQIADLLAGRCRGPCLDAHHTAVDRGCEVKNLDFPAGGQGRDTGVVRTYGQYCPIARGAEIFAERWTPLIIRNLYLGCGSFSEILEGAPGLSRTLLSQRLKHLERLGIVESATKLDGRGRHYELTRAGQDLFKVCRSLGEWGAHWLEIAPEHLDPFVALWSMCNMLRRDRLPARRVVIRFDFTGRQRAERYWLLIEHGEHRNLQDVSRPRRGPLHHRGSRSLRQMARRPANLGRSHPRRPHPTPRPLVARTSLPHLERPQRLRPHQAGLPENGELGSLTSSTRPPIAAPHRRLDRDGPINRRRGAAEGRRLKRPREHHEIEGPASRLPLLKCRLLDADPRAGGYLRHVRVRFPRQALARRPLQAAPTRCASGSDVQGFGAVTSGR